MRFRIYITKIIFNLLFKLWFDVVSKWTWIHKSWIFLSQSFEWAHTCITSMISIPSPIVEIEISQPFFYSCYPPLPSRPKGGFYIFHTPIWIHPDMEIHIWRTYIFLNKNSQEINISYILLLNWITLVNIECV